MTEEVVAIVVVDSEEGLMAVVVAVGTLIEEGVVAEVEVDLLLVGRNTDALCQVIF